MCSCHRKSASLLSERLVFFFGRNEGNEKSQWSWRKRHWNSDKMERNEVAWSSMVIRKGRTQTWTLSASIFTVFGSSHAARRKEKSWKVLCLSLSSSSDLLRPLLVSISRYFQHSIQLFITAKAREKKVTFWFYPLQLYNTDEISETRSPTRMKWERRIKTL